MIQFYNPELEENAVLGPEESGHCCRVLRKKEGDEIYVTDGKGRRARCVITDANPRGVMYRIEEISSEPRHWNHRIALCVAPSKNIDRIEWLIEKAVEIGVDRIVMMRCRRSERKVVKIDRLRKIAISAMNQSLKTVVTDVEDMTDIRDVFREGAGYGCRVFGYCDDNFSRNDFISVYDGEEGRDVMILIGPEGDFSPEEVKEAVESGFTPVTFGPVRLHGNSRTLRTAGRTHP